MPGVFQLSSIKWWQKHAAAYALGIPSVLLFGIPAAKDPIGLENFASDGIVQQAVRALKTRCARTGRHHRCLFV